MISTRFIATFGFITLALASCETATVTSLGAVPPKPDGCAIDVYYTASEVQKPYDVICSIEAKTGSSIFHDHSVGKAISIGKEYACRCGADGIILSQGIDPQISLSLYRGKAILQGIRYK